MNEEINFEQLNKNYLKNLKSFMNSNLKEKNSNLKEYYQYLCNSIDHIDEIKQEEKKLTRKRTSEKLNELENRAVKIKWNLDYCEVCKVDYWPSNCCVYIEPKHRMTYKNAKLHTKYKLFDCKPRYNSYKDKLLSNIIKKGIRMIYKCKRCGSKNLILNQAKRKNDLKLIKFNKHSFLKNLKEKVIKGKVPHSVSFNNTVDKTKQLISNSKTLDNLVVYNQNSMASKAKLLSGKKKFQSLQVKLRQSEEESTKNQSQKSTASLNDFLMQLT